MATTLPPTPQYAAIRNGQADAAPEDALPPRVPGGTSATLAKAHERLKRVRDVLGGIDTLRAARETYLPKLSGEDDPDYDVRLVLANFFNTPRRTVKGVAGLICQRDPVVGADGGATFAKHWEAIDDRGNHGAVFTRRFVEDATAAGFAGILVDMPTVRPGQTITDKDAERLNLRPYWVPIRYEHVQQDPEWVMLGAQRVLVYLELHESVSRWVPGQSDRETVSRYRVYERAVERDPATDVVTKVGPPTLRLWEKGPNDGAPRPLGPAAPVLGKGRTALSRIPFEPCIAGDLEDDAAAWVVRPPILDLVDLAVSWYQVFAERRNLENKACTVTPVLVGYEPEMEPDPSDATKQRAKTLRFGPSRAIIIRDPQGNAFYLAPPGDGFAPTKETLEALDRRGAVIGIGTLFTERREPQTATGERIEAAPQFGILSAIARAVQDTLEGAAGLHAEYVGEPPPSITVNTDFERITADPAMIDALTRLAGEVTPDGLPLIRHESVLALLERWRVLPDGFDIAGEVAKIRELFGAGAGRGSTNATPPADGAGARTAAAALVAELEAEANGGGTGEVGP